MIIETITLVECPETIRLSYKETITPMVAQRYQNLIEVIPEIHWGPSERALCERLATMHSEIATDDRTDSELCEAASIDLPIEYRFSFFKLGDSTNPYDETLVLYVDQTGRILGISHSQ